MAIRPCARPMRRLPLLALTAACASARPAASSPTAPSANAAAPPETAPAAAGPAGAPGGPRPSIASKVAGARALPGLFPLYWLYWDERAGKRWLEIGRWQTEFLCQSGLPARVGSNDIGLDAASSARPGKCGSSGSGRRCC